MLTKIFVAMLLMIQSAVVSAGDYVGGPIEYKVDLSESFTAYKITEKDIEWANNLAKKFKYKEKLEFFTKTTIPVFIEGQKTESYVYQCINRPEYFYVIEGDAMLKIGAEQAVSPGGGGFSMIAPKSKNLIVCFNCFSGGIPFESSSKVKKGKVKWRGSDIKRI